MVEFVRDEWRADPRQPVVWIVVYRAMLLAPDQITSPVIIDVADVRAVVVHGQPTFMDVPAPRVTATQGIVNVEMGRIERRGCPEDSYLVLLTPLEVTWDGTVERTNEPDVHERLGAMVGFLAALIGRNIAYERVFETSIEVASGNTSVYARTIINPYAIGTPNLGSRSLTRISEAAIRIGIIREQDRNRLELSLRWYERAIFEESVDGFLRCWIALETLTMDSTNIRPINEVLARISGLPYKVARDRFHVGRLYGLRSKIVHDGQRPRISAVLIDYMRAIYEDCLLDFLTLPPQLRASRLLLRRRSELAAYLR